MKKTILSLLLVVVMLAGMFVVPVNAAGKTIDAYCQHCKETKTWMALETVSDSITGTSYDHYFMASTGGRIIYGAKTITGTVCLDLDNQEYRGNRRLIVADGATLNIQGQDTGVLSGLGADGFGPGGAIWVQEGGTVNMYGGNLLYRTHSQTNRGATNGGAIAVDGTFNMYGGTVKDGIATGLGGSVYVGPTGQFNMYGGTVKNGTAATAPCVYNSGKLLLAGNATLDSVLQAPVEGGPVLGEMLTVKGAYTGGTSLLTQTALAEGLDVGNSDGADLTNASILLPNSDLRLMVSGSNLVAQTPPVVFNKDTGSSGNSLAVAVENAQPGNTLVLYRNTSEAFTATKNLILDLNGCSIANTVSADQGATLYVKDSKTADYTVSDDNYGKVNAISGDVQGLGEDADGNVFVKIREDGGISFHAVSLKIKKSSLRPDEVGLYFKCDFSGDELVAENVTSFGIAMSVTGEPDESTLENPKHFTRFEKSDFGTGEENTSTILSGIMKGTNGYNTNQRNAAMSVYGRAYIEIDGVYTFGMARSRSLKEQLEGIDEKWASLTSTEKNGAAALYNRFTRILKQWNIPSLVYAVEVEEEETMKILSIGQSHSQDSIWLVQEVLQTEMPEGKFLIAECLKSVTMVEHLSNAKSDAPVYDYYVNTSGEWVLTKEDCAIRSALLDQKWDIVIINESSRYLGLEATMSKGYVSDMAKWVRSLVGDEPKLLYNWTWTTPISQTFYDPNFDPQPSTSFWSNYERDYNANRETHYNMMLEMLEKYVEPIEEIDGILYSATPIQYATEVLKIPEAEPTTDDPTDLPYSLADYSMYRDYIHLSDYGRLFIAYMWYAQIYGLEEITEVNVDVIEAHLRQWRWVSQGDVTLTQQMKDWIIESVNYALKNPKTMPEAN